MQRLHITLALVLGMFLTGAAQEAGVFTHYYLNPVLINPGATGFNNDHQIILNYRNRWAGFDESPRTFTALYNGAVGDRVGVGAQLLSDRVGKYRNFMGAGSFAYRFEAGDIDFGAGIQFGFEQRRIDNVNDDPFIDDTDELLNEAIDGVSLFDASFGLHGEYDDRLFFGVSFPDLIRTRLTSISGSLEDDNEEFNFILYGGYRFDVDSDNFSIEPSIAIKNVRRVPFHVDFNLKFSFLEEQLVAGLTYAAGDFNRFGLLLGTRINDLRLFYSYDVGFGEFQEYNNGSHEISITYRFARRADAPADN